MFDWVSNMPRLAVRNKEINYLIGKTDIKCKRLVFRNFKQTLHYKVAIEEDIYFLCIVHDCFPFLRWVKFCSGRFRQVFFHLGDKKKWLLVALDR